MENRTRFRVENGEMVMYVGSVIHNEPMKYHVHDIEIGRNHFYGGNLLDITLLSKSDDGKFDFEYTIRFFEDKKTHEVDFMGEIYPPGFAAFKPRSWDGFLMSAVQCKFDYLAQREN